MNPQFNRKNHLLLMALAALYPLSGFAAGAARVEFVTGNVVAVNAAGVQRDLMRGTELESGDAVRTGANSRAQLRFSDGGMMSIQPGTEFRIDNYKFDGKADGTERGFFSVVKGGLRAISGTIGHGSNQDNYRVNTPVATIGIRGTEYFLVYTGGDNGQLSVRTGEGAVIVQNAGGAIVVPSGGAAVVTGSSSKPQETNTFVISSGTSSAPTVVTVAAAPVATTENRTTDGGLAALASAGGLTSGPGYVVGLSAMKEEPANQWNPLWSYDSAATATFDSGLKLTSVKYSSSNNGDSYTAGTVTSAFVLDGVLGWGSWSSGTVQSTNSGVCMSGSCNLQSVHYVVGIPTSASDLSALISGGMQATYQVAGYTTPTSSAGATFGSLSTQLTTLTANFGSYSVSGNVNLTMNAGEGGPYTVNGSFAGSLGGASFSAEGMAIVTGASSSSGSMHVVGIIAGANASHAGLAYQINSQNSALGSLNGAVAFTQKSLTPVSPSP